MTRADERQAGATDEGIPASHPAIVVVDADPVARRAIEKELTRRYADDYRIVTCEDTAAEPATLQRLHDEHTPVALVMAAASPPTGGLDMLAQVGEIYPHAGRALLVDFGDWGDAAIAAEIRQAIAEGHADYYVLRPWRRAEELFHRSVCEFLYDYSRTDPQVAGGEYVVVADRWSQRGHEIRHLLARNGIPHVYREAGSPAARKLLDGEHPPPDGPPVVVTLAGEILHDPTDEDLARHYGVTTALDGPRDVEVAVVGAGPGGLAAAISAAAEGLSVLVLECTGIGGQAATSSLIRNYLGFPRGVRGAELAQRAYQQAWAFGAEVLHMREATGLRRVDDHYVLSIEGCPDVTASTVLLATGVDYRRLGVPALEALIGRGVYYGASVSEARSVADGDVFVIGGGNSAGQAALHLARSARHVTVVTRRSELSATMSSYLEQQIEQSDRISVRPNCQLVDGGGNGHLTWLAFDDDGGKPVHADAAFVFVGGEPRTAWLPSFVQCDERGFVLTGPDVTDPPEGHHPAMFETSAPGVFAIGDVRAGSIKRVASAVGEGSVVVPHMIAHVAGAVPRPQP